MRLVFDLFKLRIGFAIALTALAGAMVAPSSAGPGQVIVIVLAVLVASAAAGAFNQYVEADLDRRMQRTRGRVFATGRFTRHGGWLALIAALVGGATIAAASLVNPVAALYTFLGAFFYGVVYTVWLKRRTAMNIVVGGLAGSFAVMAGAAAISPLAALTPLPLAFAWILFLWTPPHFWSLAIVCRRDYAAAGVPMLPVVVGDSRAARAILASGWLLVVASFVPALFGLHLVYLAFAAAGGAYFLLRCHELVRRPGRMPARKAFLASLVQLSAVLLGAMADVAIF